MKLQKFGAIDIGSNAMRLLIAQVLEDEDGVNFKKVSLVRLPIRLGQEAFTDKKISDDTYTRFIQGMMAYKYLLEVHQVVAFKACATSAMREAKNGKKIVDEIKDKTGIDVEIIDGKVEAEYIFNGHFHDQLDNDSNYIYVDVGGGSTEVTILSNGQIKSSKSFKIGTIRLLNEMVTDTDWAKMKAWIKTQTKALDHVEMIGSGGNINKLYKLAGKTTPRPMLYHELKQIKNELSTLSFEQRMKKYKLNPDRSDVIVLAGEIYFSAMKWSDASIIHVPKIGLTDGIVMDLYQKHIGGNN